MAVYAIDDCDQGVGRRKKRVWERNGLMGERKEQNNVSFGADAFHVGLPGSTDGPISSTLFITP